MRVSRAIISGFAGIFALLLAVTPLAAAQINTSGLYVAMGDSVAAGAGLPAPANPANNDTICGVSGQSYPVAIAAHYQMRYLNLACSGARLTNLYSQQGLVSGKLAPQLDNAFRYGTPGLMTITAGANDMNWVQFLEQCYSGTCGGSMDSAQASAYRAQVTAHYTRVMQEIADRSTGSPPPVYVTGYYKAIAVRCATGNITTAEISWFNNQTDRLNQTIQSAIQPYTFAHFVPVSFAAHDICSGSSWVQSLSDKAPLHPTAAGQTAIADAILHAINGGTGSSSSHSTAPPTGGSSSTEPMTTTVNGVTKQLSADPNIPSVVQPLTSTLQFLPDSRPVSTAPCVIPAGNSVDRSGNFISQTNPYIFNLGATADCFVDQIVN